MSIKAYAKRVIKERNELKVKVDKLTEFLDSERVRRFLAKDIILLEHQLGAMSVYLEILNQRIGRFEEVSQ